MKKKWFIFSVFVFVLLLLVSGYFYMCSRRQKMEILVTPKADSLYQNVVIPMLYRIPVDSFTIVTGKVMRNQTLSTILKDYNLGDYNVQHIVDAGNGIFDFRKIKQGNKITFFLSRDTLQIVKHVVYEHTPVEYIKISFDDTLTVVIEEKEIIVKREFARGVIQTSLWNTMIDNEYNPLLANDLSEIYAWSIDFFGLQEGDSFSVVYDEVYVDTLAYELGKIHAAYFKHSGKEFYAIPFYQDSVRSFYDLEGNSLRKTFLKAPLSYSRISSGFSHSRMHPILRIRRPHHGVDYAAPKGTPVYAIGDGKIIKASGGYNNGAGNMIKIKHNGVYTTAYLHLSGFARGIKTGVFVKQGDLIGYVGSTGLSTGPHLDFRFYKNGRAVNPLHVEAPPVEPVKEENREEFDSVKTEVIKLLKSI